MPRGSIRFIYFLLFALIATLWTAPEAPARGDAPLEYEVKAAFLYNFPRFIDWPAAAFETNESPLVFGVLGPNPFDGALREATDGKTIDGRPIELRHGSRLDEIGNVHVLFINEPDPRRQASILEELEGKPVLTVSDYPNFTRAGGTIRFFVRDRRIAFEVNVAAAERAGLRMSSRLLNLAHIYRE